MVDLVLDQLDRFGLIQDSKPFKLPPEAWTELNNVRFEDGGLRKLKGHTEVFPSAPVAPGFLLPVRTPAEQFWLYTSLLKAYVWNGSVHTDLTRTSGGDYGASHSSEWQGLVFGGIALLNNGADAPQFWATPSVGTKLADLTNWPASTTCKRIAALKRHLVAIDVTESGTRHPHRVRWSQPADPGSVPTTWDYTDPANDSGVTELDDVNSGVLIDAVNLRDRLFLYKSNSIYSMRYIGGQFVFAFERYLETAGLLAPGCATSYGAGFRHFVVTEDDIIIHAGQGEPQSILDTRMRRTLFNNINPTQFSKSYAFHNLPAQEVWFCYPSAQSTEVDSALVWDYQGGGVGKLFSTQVDYNHLALGIIESADAGTWDADTEAWDDDETLWANASRLAPVAAVQVDTKFYQIDKGETRDGDTFVATAQRTDLAIIGRQRDGQWRTDFTQRKLVTRIWLDAEGEFKVRLGSQEMVEGSVTWLDYQDFVGGVDKYLDFEAEGAAIAIEFTSNQDKTWKVNSYTLDLVESGEF